MPFNFDDTHKLEESHLTQKDDKLQKELWRWHLKLNHLSKGKLPK